jgi:hypothetical protein
MVRHLCLSYNLITLGFIKLAIICLYSFHNQVPISSKFSCSNHHVSNKQRQIRKINISCELF